QGAASPLPVHARLVPDRSGCLVHTAIGPEYHEPVKRPGEPAIVRHGQHRARVGLQALLQCLGAGQVEFVGGLIQQEKSGTGQLEQQNLQSRPLSLQTRCQKAAARQSAAHSVQAPPSPRWRQGRARSSGSQEDCVLPGRGGRGSGRRCPRPPSPRGAARLWARRPAAARARSCRGRPDSCRARRPAAPHPCRAAGTPGRWHRPSRPVCPSPTRNETSSSSTPPSGRAWLRCAASTCPTKTPVPLAARMADNSRVDPEGFDPNSRLRASDADRDSAASVINSALAEGRLSADEHSDRLDAIYSAKTHAEIAPLLDDLPSHSTAAVPATTVPATTSTGQVAARSHRGWIVAVLSGANRKGIWHADPVINVLTVLGGAELDFREAVLPGKEISLRAVSVLGGVTVIVPPEMRVVDS